MPEPSFWPGFVAVAIVTAIVLVALLGIGLAQPGPRRAGLVAGGLPLALVPPSLAAVYVSWKLIAFFAVLAPSADASQSLLDASARLGMLLRAGWGGFAAACLLGLLVGLLRTGRDDDDSACSVRRGAVLVLLPLLGVLVAGPLTHVVMKALRVTAAVATLGEGSAESRERSEALLEAAGFPMRDSGSIGAVPRFVTRATMLGTFGGVTAAVVLLGLALPGFILAWRVRFGGAFLAFASAAWLLAAAFGSALAFGAL